MKTKLIRLIFVILGCFFLVLGILGIFLPLLPTTPFLILTAICFNKGSDKFHFWLIHHKYLGPPILDWQKYRVIRPRHKILATLLITGSGILVFSNPRIPELGKYSFFIFLLILMFFIWRVKSKTN